MGAAITNSSFLEMITTFAKSITYTPVTKSTSNLTGDETLTDGTPSTISGAFYRKEDSFMQDKFALLDNADAILIVAPTVTLSKNDKVTYDSQTYRIDKVVTRRIGTVSFYNLAQCFKI